VNGRREFGNLYLALLFYTPFIVFVNIYAGQVLLPNYHWHHQRDIRVLQPVGQALFIQMQPSISSSVRTVNIVLLPRPCFDRKFHASSFSRRIRGEKHPIHSQKSCAGAFLPSLNIHRGSKICAFRCLVCQDIMIGPYLRRKLEDIRADCGSRRRSYSSTPHSLLISA